MFYSPQNAVSICDYVGFRRIIFHLCHNTDTIQRQAIKIVETPPDGKSAPTSECFPIELVSRDRSN